MSFLTYALTDYDRDHEMWNMFEGDNFEALLDHVNIGNHTLSLTQAGITRFLSNSIAAMNPAGNTGRILMYWEDCYGNINDNHDTLVIYPLKGTAMWHRHSGSLSPDEIDFDPDDLQKALKKRDYDLICRLLGIRSLKFGSKMMLFASEFDFCTDFTPNGDFQQVMDGFEWGDYGRGLLISRDENRTYPDTIKECDCVWTHVGSHDTNSVLPTNNGFGETKFFKPFSKSQEVMKTWCETEDEETPTPTKETTEMATVKTTATESKTTKIVAANKSAAIAAGKIEAGRIVVNKLTKLVAPKLPLMMRGYADTAFGKVVIANVVNIAVEQYAPDNEKARLLAEAAMQGAALELIQSFNVEDLLEQVTAGISMETLRKAAGQAE